MRPLESSQELSTPDRLETLFGQARPRTQQDQQTLMMGLAELYRDRLTPKPDSLTDMFVELTRQAEREVRRLLAERLTHADWAPKALVTLLASDEIEIAKPLIAYSPLLDDEDLLDLLEQASIEHQIEVAQRPYLGQRPCNHIIERGQAVVMTALAGNRSALLDPSSLNALIDHSRTLIALRAPLTRHPRLDQALALKLYPLVGETLRDEIARRFPISAERLAQATEVAAHQATGLATDLDEEAASLLIQKLHLADQLRPAYLIRAIREGRLRLFAHGLACLGNFPLAQVHQALNAPSARPLYLACTSVGVDRAAFGPLLANIQALNKGYPMDPDQSGSRLADRSRHQAEQEFRTLMNDLNAGMV